MGDLAENFISLSACRPDQDAHAVPRRRTRLQRAGPGRPTDVSGAAQPRDRYAIDYLSQRESRHHEAKLHSRSLRAVPGLVRQVCEEESAASEECGGDRDAIVLNIDRLNLITSRSGRRACPRCLLRRGSEWLAHGQI